MDDITRWNARYRDLVSGAVSGTSAVSGPMSAAELVLEPPSALVRCARHLPEAGVAIDLAGGNGGGVLWLARRGLHPVLVEASDVAIDQALVAAAAKGLTIDALQCDLGAATLSPVIEAVSALPRTAAAGPIAIVSCFHYLQRSLLASVADGLAPGAVFVAAIATTTNRERNDHPSPRFLLEPGELFELVVGSADAAGPLEVLHSHEGWNDGNHHEAELVVRREA